MKIVDCFPFYNETDLLYYRLSVLYDKVDFFIISESTRSFAGHEKKSVYLENRDRYKKFQDKIIHLIDNEFKTGPGNDWYNENHQREFIKHGLKSITLSDNDIIISSDLDEIPDPSVIKKIKNGEIVIDNIASLEMDMYYYNLTLRKVESWSKAKVFRYDTLMNRFQGNPHNTRLYDNCEKINRGGWHLSYFGNAEKIKNKIINFAHQEYNTQKYTNIDFIKNHIEKGIDLFDRDGGEKLLRVPISENTYLPVHYDKYLTMFF